MCLCSADWAAWLEGLYVLLWITMLIIEEKHKKQQVVNKKVCYFSFGELSMRGSVFQ